MATFAASRSMMSELGYDAKKLPLGKLSKETIEGGYEVLKEIAALLNGRGKPSESVLQDLSSQFYTVVPHSFGRRLPPVLKTKQQLKEKLDMCSVRSRPICYLHACLPTYSLPTSSPIAFSCVRACVR